MTLDDLNSRPEDRREKVIERQEGGYEHREHIVEDVASERRLSSLRLTRFIYLLFAVLESLIGLRILFKLIEANAANPFAHYVYRFTDLFLKPFTGLTTNPSVGGIVLEITSLIGLLVYVLLCWLIVQLVRLIFYRSHTRTVTIQEKSTGKSQ